MSYDDVKLWCNNNYLTPPFLMLLLLSLHFRLHPPPPNLSSSSFSSFSFPPLLLPSLNLSLYLPGFLYCLFLSFQFLLLIFFLKILPFLLPYPSSSFSSSSSPCSFLLFLLLFQLLFLLFRPLPPPPPPPPLPTSSSSSSYQPGPSALSLRCLAVPAWPLMSLGSSDRVEGGLG